MINEMCKAFKETVIYSFKYPVWIIRISWVIGRDVYNDNHTFKNKFINKLVFVIVMFNPLFLSVCVLNAIDLLIDYEKRAKTNGKN